MVGSSVRRKEDPRLISGEGRFIDDITVPRMCFASFVRSTYAHAIVKSIDVSRAKELRGVIAVLTAKDLVGEHPKGIPVASLPSGSKLPGRYPLAVDEVNYVGEPIAIAIAENRYVAKDATDLVEVDYGPKESVTDPEKALESGSPRVHKEFGDNIAYQATLKFGDADAAFRSADHVVTKKLVAGRIAPIPLENRGVIASYAGNDGSLTVWLSTQIPHMIKTWYADYLGIPENKVRVIAPDVGGGFGAKAQMFSDEIAVVLGAMKLGRPVKWISTRMEDLLATSHARGQIHHIELALDKGGVILGLRGRIIGDCGAYLHLFTIGNLQNTLAFITGSYDIRNVNVELLGVFTNKTSMDAFRGAGVPEAFYAIEASVDEAARAIGIDRAEIRVRNFVKSDQFPYTNPSGMTYDSGDYEMALRKVLSMSNYEKLRERQEGMARGGRRLGIGIASYVLVGGFGPSKLAADRMGGYDSARVRVEPDGRVSVYTGTSTHGQGGDTTLAQVAADELQVDLDNVTVLHGDTDSSPYGFGTQGSRAAVVGGQSVLEACKKIKAKSIAIAAYILEARTDQIIFDDGKFQVNGPGEGKTLTLAEVAREASFMKNLPEGMEPYLETTVFYEPRALTYAFGTHVAVVEVDHETGRVEIKEYYGVDDCGKAINPMIVEGQIHGGVANGIGQAMYEEIMYDDEGQLLTSTLSDYAIPSATEIPRMFLDRTETPAPTALGVKGIGEAGPIVGAAVIASAVADAIGLDATEVGRLPLRSDYVWDAIRRGKKRA
ncbi:MAG: xanthine dehydrogenase family protein [Thaumarchaeota archaeon]|nr:xanthine dehydrogenase family protein [Nitrososphaerota archaeon]